jgi:universal stress protein A
MNIRKILFPTDFSEHALAALPMAENIAKANGSTIVIAHVYEPALTYGTGLAAAFSALPQEIRENASHLLDQVQLSDPDIPVERKLLQGTPAISLCKFAQEAAIDLIMMSTHGRTGLSGLVMGNVGQSVVKGAPCPVLTLSSHTSLPS